MRLWSKTLSSITCQLMICSSVNYPPQYVSVATCRLEEDSVMRISGVSKFTACSITKSSCSNVVKDRECQLPSSKVFLRGESCTDQSHSNFLKVVSSLCCNLHENVYTYKVNSYLRSYQSGREQAQSKTSYVSKHIVRNECAWLFDTVPSCNNFMYSRLM